MEEDYPAITEGDYRVITEEDYPVIAVFAHASVGPRCFSSPPYPPVKFQGRSRPARILTDRANRK
jgi:hypothetical protein